MFDETRTVSGRIGCFRWLIRVAPDLAEGYRQETSAESVASTVRIPGFAQFDAEAMVYQQSYFLFL